MIDPQRDVIDHSKRSKPLGEATQFNGRQSHHSLYSFARILPQISLRNLRKLDCEAKTGAHFCGIRAGARRWRPLIYRWITIRIKRCRKDVVSGRAGANKHALIPPPRGEGGRPKVGRVGGCFSKVIGSALPCAAPTPALRADPPHRGEG